MTVYVVTEGEAYYTPWLVHAVFSQQDVARQYARELVRGNESTRWGNTTVYTLEVDRPGHVEMEVIEVESK